MTDAIQTADRNCAVFQNGASPNKLSAAPGSSVANPFQIYVQSRWTCPSVGLSNPWEVGKRRSRSRRRRVGPCAAPAPLGGAPSCSPARYHKSAAIENYVRSVKNKNGSSVTLPCVILPESGGGPTPPPASGAAGSGRP